MKRLLLSLAFTHFKQLVCILIVYVFIQKDLGYAQTVEAMVVEEDCPAESIIVKPQYNAKQRRASYMHRGVIDTEYKGENMPDSLKTCIDIASELWSSYLLYGDSLKLHVYYDDIYSADIVTTIYYQSASQTFYPQSLFRKLYGKELVQGTYPDAIIHINKNANWNIGVGGISSNAKNLSYAMMRATARALGFGSSVKSDSHGNIVFYTKRGHSVFDGLIFSSMGEKLTDLSPGSQALSNFATGKSGVIYAHKPTDGYKLYAPSSFDEDKSLKYVMNDKSLMYYGSPNDTIDLIADSITANLLNAIGWEVTVNAQNIEIVGEGLGKTGIASAYQSHRFYLKENGMTISERHWKYELPLKNGGRETVKVSNGIDFTIPAITDENKYAHTIEGDICGTITCEAKSGNTYMTATYNVTLELKPHIISTDILSITPSKDHPYLYDILFNVRYEGSHYLYTTVTEEYNSSFQPFFSDVPYYANLNLTNIDLDGPVWIEVTVRNEYGSDYKFIDISDISYPLESGTPPSKPKFSSIEFSYDGFDFETLYFINPMFKFVFDSEGAENIIMSVSDPWISSKDNIFFFCTMDFTDSEWLNRTGKNTFVLETDLAYAWQQYMLIIAENKYGYTKSDTLNTSDYITDPAVIAAFKAEMERLAIRETEKDEPRITLDGEWIYIDNVEGSKIKRFSLANVSGCIIAEKRNENRISISNIPHGLYVITIMTSDGKKTSKKIAI